MEITISPEDEKYLQTLVDAGFYSSVEEAIIHAVQMLREEEKSNTP
jgi:Arc/MetJ-type ribon-helix-helix transcriptional regulator